MELTERVEVLETKVAEVDTRSQIKFAEIDARAIAIDGEVDAIQAIHKNREKIIDLNQTVAGLYRVVKATLIAGIGAGLISYGNTALQDATTANDEQGIWTSRGGLAAMLYSIVVLTNQEAIAASLISTINPWKK